MIATPKKTKPYQEVGGVRIFQPGVPIDDLEWHVDFEDRIVYIIKSGGWSFQFDDALPKELSDGDVLTINKFVWHRVISGNDQLIVKIISSGSKF